jgi:hypothetical protein
MEVRLGGLPDLHFPSEPYAALLNDLPLLFR